MEGRSDAARLRVLIVEDNPEASRALTLLLTLLGHEVREASSGTAALAVFDMFDPDVAFIDINVPDMAGDEIARHVRARADGRQPYIVAVSGWSEDEVAKRSRPAAFDGYVGKPVDVAKIRAVLAVVAGAATAPTATRD